MIDHDVGLFNPLFQCGFQTFPCQAHSAWSKQPIEAVTIAARLTGRSSAVFGSKKKAKTTSAVEMISKTEPAVCKIAHLLIGLSRKYEPSPRWIKAESRMEMWFPRIENLMRSLWAKASDR